jgi:uncharacterized protein with NRDE domain
MCVAAFAWQAHPRWHFVAVANRDEFHERPAAPLAAWENGSGIVAGRDLRSGGTWLGLTETGRLALVTNLRGHGPAEPDRPSRGALVTGLLTGELEPESVEVEPYNPFNLVLIDPMRAAFLSNRPQTIRTDLAHGIYGLSNGTLDEPWPKTLQLKAALLDWLMSGQKDLEPLFTALTREEIPEFGIHPEAPSDIPREAPDTPVFIRDAIYGTRCSTVVTIGRDGRGLISELSFDSRGARTGRVSIGFNWNLCQGRVSPAGHAG